MKVDIHEHLEDGTSRRVATFFWRGEEIACDNPVLWKHLMNSNGGVIIGSRGKRYYPRDGAEYLRNLKYQFAGPYLHAGPVEEEEGDRPDAARVVAGTSGATSSRDLSSLDTVKTQQTKVRPDGTGGPSRRPPPDRRAGPWSRSCRQGAGQGEGRKSGQADTLSRNDLETVCGGVYRASAALRGLGGDVARLETDRLLEAITQIAGVDRGELTRAFESREAYLELRYQPPSRQNYEKLWHRAGQYWMKFLDVLEAGEIETALWPLYMVREAMRCLPAHRTEWLAANDFEDYSGTYPAGTSPEDVEESWQVHGRAAFRKKGLSRVLLEEAFGRTPERFEAAVVAFREAEFGRSEAEARRALSIDPGFIDARLVLGDILRRLDQATASMVELQRTVELEVLRARAAKGRSPDATSLLRLARARVCIGKTFLSEGRIRSATAQLERGVDTFERMSRGSSAGFQDEAATRQVRDEKMAVHHLLERIYRDLGDLERADHHRKRLSAP